MAQELGQRPGWQRWLREAYAELWDGIVDPREAWWDEPGPRWDVIGSGGNDESSGWGVGSSEAELTELRRECRWLAVTNEFAINGHENRISYIVGAGHSYRAIARRGEASAPELEREVQRVLDEFVSESCWHERQQEIVRRRDRDGEVFLRFFTGPRGETRVRFVEPGQVRTPSARSGEPAHRLGVVTERDDVEAVVGYYIDGELVAADEIQHRKANVDRNVRRGLPLYFPVRKNLRRAEKLLRNMSVVAEIQSAIALIRKHAGGTRSALQQFVGEQADVTQAGSEGRAAQHFRRYGPGSILDVAAGVEYDFPASGLNAANYVAVLQAELRAIASRLVMPEFMLTSDASNANYSSTLVAESPAVRMFERLQAEQVAADLQVMQRVVEQAVAGGRLPRETRERIELRAAAPSLEVRDRVADEEVARRQFEAGILSPQTWSQRRGLDYEQEQRNLREHRAALELAGCPPREAKNGAE